MLAAKEDFKKQLEDFKLEAQKDPKDHPKPTQEATKTEQAIEDKVGKYLYILKFIKDIGMQPNSGIIWKCKNKAK